MTSFKYITIALLFLFSNQCADDSDDRDSQSLSCEGILCTEEFRSLLITVQNSDGEPVRLDSYTVTDTTTGEQLSFSQQGNEPGSYILYTDKYAAVHQNTERTLVFEGMIASEVVVRSEYRVGADCCHVLLLSGEETLVTNL